MNPAYLIRKQPSDKSFFPLKNPPAEAHLCSDGDKKEKKQECLRTHERMCRCEMATETSRLSSDVKEAFGLLTLECFSPSLGVFFLKDFQRPECVQECVSNMVLQCFSILL